MTTAATNPGLVEPGIYRVASRGVIRYKVRVRLEGRTGTGQKFANATKDSLKEAREFKIDAQKARRDGETKVLTDKTTFAELCAIWEAAQTVRPTTLVAYKTHTRRACEFVIGRKPMGEMSVSKIQRHHIEALVAAYEADGCSIVTCNYMLHRLRSVFNVADDMGLTQRNPARRVKGRGAAMKVRSAADASTIGLVKHVLRTGDETKDDFGLWLLTLAGLRRGEVLGMKWSDIGRSRKDARGAYGTTVDQLCIALAASNGEACDFTSGDLQRDDADEHGGVGDEPVGDVVGVAGFVEDCHFLVRKAHRDEGDPVTASDDGFVADGPSDSLW